MSKPLSLEKGAEFGPYVIEELIQTSVFFETYKASDGNGRHVAVKIALDEANQNAETTRPLYCAVGQQRATGTNTRWFPDPSWVAEREAEHLASLQIDGVASFVGLYDEHPSSRPAVVTQWVEGGPLTLAAKDTRQKWPAFFSMLEVLVRIEEQGLTFGDVKPDNVIVGAGGKATLIDPSAGATVEDSIGRPKQALLTPEYNPEGSTSDLPSLGVIYLEMLLGCHPFMHRGAAVPFWNVTPRLDEYIKTSSGWHPMLAAYPNIVPPQESDRARFNCGLAALGLHAFDGTLDRTEPLRDVKTFSELIRNTESRPGGK